MGGGELGRKSGREEMVIRKPWFGGSPTGGALCCT